jgi:type IV pilus assembly protein PilV
MVAAAVTMVAFMGLATLQVLALRSADSAMSRSQATSLAYEMIDRMRLNRGAPGSARSALGGGYDGVTLCQAEARHPQDNRDCRIEAEATLIGTDHATVDLKDWWHALGSAKLGYWYAGILRNQDRFLVAIQWDDTRAEEVAPNAPAQRDSCLGGQMPHTMQQVCVMTQL